ncbi:MULTISPECIES: DNA translocase FtsK [unclassified Cocleimonas]|uniref:DNA translocase FtsK n=1 Tax=unclassified Cocleimonas TaxID=2639732 RepID=UPI002DBAA9E0|nr:MULTISPECIES: DNA translocase FtsK 4TM domain-containing protein [unclassified Cocleimonas]
MATKKAPSKRTTRRNTKSSTQSNETSGTNSAVEKSALTSKKKGSLKQTSIFILSGVTAVILLALFSYHPADPGLFVHDSNAVIQNKAGSFGAYLADVLFGFFGYLSYLVPIAFLVSAFLLFRSSKERNNGINLGISVFGVFLALIAGCGLAILLWPSSNLAYGAGGLLGQGIARIFMKTLGDIGATMILFSGFIAGVTLFADIQWLKLIDKIGDTILSTIELFTSSSPNKESYETGTIPMSFEANLEPQKQPTNNSESASIAGAIGAGLSGMFLWKKSSADNDSGVGFNHPRFDPLDDMTTNADVEAEKPKKAKKKLLEKALGKGRKQRQEPVLGVPDYMTNEDDYHEQDVPVAGLDDVITAKKVSPTSKKVLKQEADSYQAPVQNNRQEKAAAPRVSPSISLDKAITLPPISLLNPPPQGQGHFSKEQIETHARNIVETLEHFGVRGVQIDSYYPGPIITRFELLLPPGTKVSKISGLAQDMARSMCVSSIRIVEVIKGKTTIGLEVPNDTRDLVAISEILDSNLFKEAKSPLTMVLGKTIAGKPAIADLARMPHLLIAGTTGSGKSVGVNAMLMSLLYKSTPDEVKLIMIDPKMLELSIYEGIPHLLTPVVTDMKDAANSLRWAVGEMERRYALMSHLKVRNVAGYNGKIKEAMDKGEPLTDPTFDPTMHVDVRPSVLEPLPSIVIVIDEFADMMMVVGKKVEELIARLAQKARAAGIHLILATQRPSVDVITGLIKANIPTRIAFQVSTRIDSRTILDQGGAESLLGHGDMLYLPPGTGLPQRVHGAFVDDSEVEDVVAYWKLQGEPQYLEDVIQETGSPDAIPGLEPLAESETDALYDQAVAIVTESRRASISYVQRRLKVGYNRAASMIEDMEAAGVVSAVQSNGTREVLAPEPPKD